MNQKRHNGSGEKHSLSSLNHYAFFLTEIRVSKAGWHPGLIDKFTHKTYSVLFPLRMEVRQDHPCRR